MAGGGEGASEVERGGRVRAGWGGGDEEEVGKRESRVLRGRVRQGERDGRDGWMARGMGV